MSADALADASPGARLRAAREAAGLTQAAMGALLGMTQGAIHQVEAGRRAPSRPWLLWAALKLGWPPSALDPGLAFADPAGDRLTLELHPDGAYRPATAADAARLSALGWPTGRPVDPAALADAVRLAGRLPVYLVARPDA